MALLTDNEQHKITQSKEFVEFLDKFKLPYRYEIPYKLGRFLALAYQAYEAEQRQENDFNEYKKLYQDDHDEEFSFRPGGYVSECAYGFLNLIREDLNES